ncbi:CAAX prenyl protease 2 [Porphyridium purpureum]|uniref:intramembrane prenyl-peptidase Rce1 n=1 Tax=Porphyridium purpureum TaxID=35688 RepID=A0A5J4YJ88_PORPP|nr:CAAX prenyl protease 2 [Porphyridium purpureum]|eukprot:POR3793..scf291_13
MVTGFVSWPPPPPSPQIPCVAAVVGVVCVALAFVSVLYVPAIQKLPRNSPAGVRVRSLATLAVALLATLLCELLSLWLCVTQNNYDSMTCVEEVLNGIDLRRALLATCSSLALTLAIYVPDICYTVMSASVDQEQGRWTSWSSAFFPERGWIAARNYVLAPLSEELAFRAACVRVLLECPHCSFGTWVAVSLPAALFAIAHAHHVVERLRESSTSKHQIAVVTLFQLAYTLAFGLFAGWLYAQTRSVGAPIIAHVVCNVLQLPNFGGMLLVIRQRDIRCALLLLAQAFSYFMTWTCCTWILNFDALLYN